mmetsp:Transcript_42495/g.122875  ORF Transcript_42495/g.122875 Transcript_42495/m.122875 type:complete len:205 (+) Transcript_42495:430-1044(+)
MRRRYCFRRRGRRNRRVVGDLRRGCCGVARGKHLGAAAQSSGRGGDRGTSFGSGERHAAMRSGRPTRGDEDGGVCGALLGFHGTLVACRGRLRGGGLTAVGGVGHAGVVHRDAPAAHPRPCQSIGAATVDSRCRLRWLWQEAEGGQRRDCLWHSEAEMGRAGGVSKAEASRGRYAEPIGFRRAAKAAAAEDERSVLVAERRRER